MEKLIQLYDQKITSFKTCWLLLAFVLTVPNLLLAQTDTTKLKQVNIPGYRAPAIQSEVPTQQISLQDFNRYSSFNVADAIRNFSGVNIKDYGGIGGLKTVSVRSLGANHLGVFYDGVELSDVQNGQIDLGKLSLNNVQTITLYNGQPPFICQPARAFASASVLAITTVHPTLDNKKPYQLQLGVNGGAFGLINPYIQWQQRISKQWSFIINGYDEQANGKYKFKNPYDGSDTLATRINDDISTQQTDAGLYWAKSDSDKFNLHTNFYNSNRGLPPAVISYNPYSAVRLQNQDFFTQAGYEHIWKNSLHLLVNSKFSQDYLRYIDPGYLNGTGGLDQQYTQREFYQSASLAFDLCRNWQVSYAVDAAYAKLDANLPKYLYPNRFTLLNVLASNFKTGKWLFQGSLLATYVNDRVTSGSVADPVSVLSPTLVVNYHANNNIQLRAYYKNIFREPTFNEQYFFAVVQIRNIKPEYAKQFDAGLTYTKNLNGFFNYVTLTADGYYNRVNNKIIVLPNQNLAISSIVNLGNVNITGADLGLKTQSTINTNWQAVLSANYTYQYAVNVTDPMTPVEIAYTPQNSFAVNAGVFDKHWGFYYNQLYSSSRYYINDNSPEYNLSGYTVGDLNITYKFLEKNKPVMLSAGVDNVFNSSYVVVRSFPMPGRSARISIQITI
jgi:vitamin B12 transporter